MNVEMWQNAATARNVARLREDGVVIAGPDVGDQACGEVGAGRMLEPAEIAAEIEAQFAPKALSGKLNTPTRKVLDRRPAQHRLESVHEDRPG